MAPLEFSVHGFLNSALAPKSKNKLFFCSFPDRKWVNSLLCFKSDGFRNPLLKN